MNRTCLVGAMVLLGLAAAGPMCAQELRDTSAAVDSAAVAAPDTSVAARRLDYQTGRVVPGAAALLEACLPEAGYLYAHDWAGGVLPIAVSLAGIALMRNSTGGASGPGRFLGFTVLLAGRAWGVAGAWSAAHSYNDALRTRLRLSVSTQAGRMQLGLAVPAP